MNPESLWLSLPEEHLDAAEELEAPTVGLSGGLDHPLTDFGAEGLAVCRRDAEEELLVFQIGAE